MIVMRLRYNIRTGLDATVVSPSASKCIGFSSCLIHGVVPASARRFNSSWHQASKSVRKIITGFLRPIWKGERRWLDFEALQSNPHIAELVRPLRPVDDRAGIRPRTAGPSSGRLSWVGIGVRTSHSSFEESAVMEVHLRSSRELQRTFRLKMTISGVGRLSRHSRSTLSRIADEIRFVFRCGSATSAHIACCGLSEARKRRSRLAQISPRLSSSAWGYAVRQRPL